MSQIASIPAFESSLALSATAATCLHARSGAFVLAPAQALALHPKESSTIRITCGSAWVTLNDGCDYFLTADQTLHAPAGSRVVMESLRKHEVVKFDWQRASEPSPLENSPLAQALLDLRGAAVLAARGLAGLGTALAAGLAGGFVRGLGAGLGAGFAALARSAHSSASRAQGRMASCESIASSGAV
jgi:hypothetical protein